MTSTADTGAGHETSLKRTVGATAAALVLTPGAGVALAALSLPLLPVIGLVTAASLLAASLVAAASGSGGGRGARVAYEPESDEAGERTEAGANKPADEDVEREMDAQVDARERDRKRQTERPRPEL